MFLRSTTDIHSVFGKGRYNYRPVKTGNCITALKRKIAKMNESLTRVKLQQSKKTKTDQKNVQLESRALLSNRLIYLVTSPAITPELIYFLRQTPL